MRIGLFETAHVRLCVSYDEAEELSIGPDRLLDTIEEVDYCFTFE